MTTTVDHSTVPDRAQTLATVRRTVRGVLESTPAFRDADPGLRRKVAEKMVGVSMLAAEQIAEDARLTEAARHTPSRPLATAQSAGDQLSMRATQEAGRTLQAIREGIDFPNYVTSLITGVFQAISSSTIQQLTAVGDLLDSVSASSSAFAATNISDDDARGWAVGQFTSLLHATGTPPRLAVRDGQDLTEQAATLKTALEATDEEVEAIDDSDLEATLLPLVKRKIGRQRQANLATMVLMGLNRIVVDEGRIHASMDMRVDTRSAAEQATRERNDVRVNTGASAQFGMGAWGASANMSASVGHVRDDQQFSQEEIASRAGLRSSVDLIFHSEPIRLDRVASDQQRQQIAANSRVPAASWTDSSTLLSSERRTSSTVTLPELPAANLTAPTAPTPPNLRTGST